MSRALARRVAALVCLASVAGAYVVACSSEEDDTVGDAGSGHDDGSVDGSSTADGSAGADGASGDGASGDGGAGDAGSHDGAVASGDAQTGEPCIFNRECIAADRCSCDEDSGACTCQVGARGTGQNGVALCDSGDQCQSSLCAEGNGAFYCTDECVNGSDCKPTLPLCEDIAFIGRICVRNPDGG